ncbi:hemolysin family protein [Rhodococcus sp. X156]|uniref:hemolysin family protein n=1 Tax=Rhodococcus sp. X156 TaxID=2499145 RepID=UPI000FD8C580|nr:hemolysin family protein [Rhodococcus sp. X156]
MPDYAAILLAVLLLALNAFFVGAEFALISSRRDRLEALADQGIARARLVMRASEQLSLMLAGSQLGITICSIALGRVGEPAVAHVLEGALHPLGIPSSVLHAISFAIALSVVVVLHILLGEMVPKNIAIAGPEKAALLLVPVMLMWVRLAGPLIAAYNWMANAVLRAFGVHAADELDTAYTTRELAGMIAESRSEGLLDAQEHRRLNQALTTAGRTVTEVLIPLENLRTLEPTAKGGVLLGALEQAVSETGYSRYPVRNPDGTLSGYLHVKDVLDSVMDDDAGPETVIPRSRIRVLPPIPANQELDEALAGLRRASSHLGRAVDAGGNTIGVVALEDLVEEFIGTVRDATHRGEP